VERLGGASCVVVIEQRGAAEGVRQHADRDELDPGEASRQGQIQIPDDEFVIRLRRLKRKAATRRAPRTPGLMREW